MPEKYSFLPINPQHLTPAQTALQRLSEKHPDFEIQAVNTIRPPDTEYTKTSQPLVPVDTPLSVIRKHIPRQSDIDKIVKCIETRMLHGPSGAKALNCTHAEALNYVVVNNFLL